MLICRDVREAYASLRTKPYCRNGTTAEDPPLRLRFRRFREDWEQFRAHDWPILRYEQFLLDPEEVLAQTCFKLQLPWDDAMLTWPKPRADILDTRHGNKTFRENCGNSLWESLNPGRKSTCRPALPVSEHRWLESEFASFNQANGYPAHIPMSPTGDAEECDLPCFEVTRRAKWRRLAVRLPQVPVPYLLKRVARWFTRDLPSATPTLSEASLAGRASDERQTEDAVPRMVVTPVTNASDRLSFSLTVAPVESVAVTVNVKDPKPRETPLMTPVLLSFMPGGKLPDVIANVTAPVPPVDCTDAVYITAIVEGSRLVVVILERD